MPLEQRVSAENVALVLTRLGYVLCALSLAIASTSRQLNGPFCSAYKTGDGPRGRVRLAAYDGETQVPEGGKEVTR